MSALLRDGRTRTVRFALSLPPVGSSPIDEPHTLTLRTNSLKCGAGLLCRRPLEDLVGVGFLLGGAFSQSLLSLKTPRRTTF